MIRRKKYSSTFDLGEKVEQEEKVIEGDLGRIKVEDKATKEEPTHIEIKKEKPIKIVKPVKKIKIKKQPERNWQQILKTAGRIQLTKKEYEYTTFYWNPTSYVINTGNVPIVLPDLFLDKYGLILQPREAINLGKNFSEKEINKSKSLHNAVKKFKAISYLII